MLSCRHQSQNVILLQGNRCGQSNIDPSSKAASFPLEFRNALALSASHRAKAQLGHIRWATAVVYFLHHVEN